MGTPVARDGIGWNAAGRLDSEGGGTLGLIYFVLVCFTLFQCVWVCFLRG